MKKALLLIITLQVFTSLSTKAQCSFTTTINNSGTATGCGPRVLTANEAGNVWTQLANFGGYGGQGAYEQIAFSIGTKGYMGLGYNSVIYGSGNDFWEYDPATDSWTQKANFGGAARQAASAFVIGTRGYVSCGYNNAISTYYNDLWEYDPSANTWTQKAALPGTTREYAAAFSIGNKGYVGTGYTSTGTLTADFYEYDPSANSWTQKANFAGGLRYSARSFAIGSKGYIGQGSDLSAAINDNWEYDPATNTWVQKANFPGPGRINAVSFAIGSRGYVGMGVNTGYTIYYNDLYQYNPLANSWTAMSPLSTLDGRYSASAFVIGANAYLMNGLSSSIGYLSSVYKYASPISYAWNTTATSQAITANTSGIYSVTLTNGAGCTATANVALVLASQPTLSLGGNTAICSGGSSTLTVSGASTYTWSNSSNATSIVVSPTAMTTYYVSSTTGTCVSTATQIVTPYAGFSGSIAVSGSSASCGSATLVAAQAGDSWMQKTNFSGAARYFAGGFSIGDRAYLGTGFTSGAVNDFYEYNYTTNTWTAKASVGAAGRYNAVVFAVGTKGYVGMGNNGTNGLNDFWEYDPAADAWTQKANFAGVPVQGAGAMVVGNNAYIVGGTEVSTNSITSQNWEFNPQANTWAMKANFPGGKRRNLATFGSSTLGYAGLGFNSIYFFDLYAYNPATDTWTSKAMFPGLGRELTAAFVIGGKAYVGTGTGSATYSDMFEYNMATDSWKALSNFSGGARYGAVAFSIGSKGYMATGYNGSAALADLWEYTLPGTYLWSNSATTQAINPLSSGLYSVNISNAGGCSSSASQSVAIAANPTLAVSGPTSNCVGNNITLLVSGASSYTWSANAGSGNGTSVSLSPSVTTNYTVSGTLGTCTSSSTYYVNGTALSASITTGGPTVSCGNQTLTAVATATTWFAKSNLAGGARSGASAFTIGNKAYIALGISSSQVYYNDLWEYDYTSDSWTQKATYPSYPRNYATAFAIGTKGYVACGNGSSILYNDLWEYNQATNVWTQKSAFPGAVRYRASGFALSGKGYVGCGINFSSVIYSDFYQYDPTTDTWTQKASLASGRHGAVSFVVGTKGYVGLGLGSTGYLADIWEYDATLDTWTAKAAFGGTARMNAVAMTIGSNAYVGTGITSSTVYNDFWKFNPGSNTWNQIANYSPGVRHSAVAVAIGGKGFVMTGQNLFFNTTTQEVYEFQPTPSYLWSTGSALTVINPSVTGLYTFTTTNYVGCTASASQSVAISPNPTTSISATSTLFCTSGSSATLTASGASSYSWSSNAGGGSATSVVVSPTIANIYTLTGTTGTCVISNTLLIDAYTTPTISVVPLTPTTMCGAVTLSANASGNTWTQKASFGGTARYGAVAFSIGNKGYYGTGFDGVNKNDFWEYDLGTNVWTQKANFGGTARRHATGFAIGNKGYVGTGFTSVAVADFWEYNPATNVWTARTNYPSSLYGCVGFAIGAKGYIQGGTSNGTSYVSSLREYDPVANTWTTKNSAPASFAFGAAFVVGNAAYVCGGQNGSGLRNTLYSFFQASGFWFTSTTFPGTSRMGCSAFAIGTKGYVIGGYDGTAKNDVYEFNTSGNTWTQRSSITTARYHAAAFAAYNHGFVIGGFTGSGNLGENWQYDARPTYSWSGSGTTEIVSLSSSGTYTLNATWAGGCTASALQTISVTPFPTITISGSTVNTCGGSVTLTGSGASTSYTWSANAGGGNSSSAVVSPTVNTTYTLSGNNGSCSGNGTVAVAGKKTFTTSIVSAIPTTTCGSITLSLSPQQGNTYTTRASLATGRYAAAAFAIGYKGYVGTGSLGSVLNDFWEYNALTDTWTQKANYPLSIQGAVGFAIGAYGYIGLGDDDNSNYSSYLYRYDPAANTWALMASLGGAGGRSFGVGFATATKGYVATGINLSGELNDLNEYDPTTNTWTVKASLPSTARRYATGFCINNKGYVGLGNNGTLLASFNDFWEYDPAANTWAQKSGYPGNGILGSNALTIGNRGFVGCGASAAGIPQSDMWEYSPTTNSWTAAASMSYSRYFGVGFSTPTRGYICTGYNGVNLSDLIEFEPVFHGAWSNGSVTTAMTTSTTGNYSVLVTNADGCTATASQTVALSPAVPLTISSTSVICAGQTTTLTASGASTYTWGATAANSTFSQVTTSPSVTTTYSVIAQTGSCVAISSVAVTVNTLPIISISATGGTAVCGNGTVTLNASSTYAWVQRATCGNSNGRMYGVAFSIGTKGYVGTGYGNASYNNDFWEYDPATNAWTQKVNFSGGARQYATGFSIGTKGYVGTGYDGSNTYNDFWEFDPIANTWTQKTNFGGGSRYAAVGFSIGTKGYIGTGIGAGYLNDLWEYDPGANSWTQKTNFGGTGRFSACAFSIGSKGYISSGYLSPSAHANDIWEYDQVGNTWTQKTSYTLAGRYDAASASANNKGYIIGGDDGNTYLSQTLEYNPVSNTWAQVASLAAGRSGACAFGIGSKLFAEGGYSVGYNDNLFEYTGSDNPFVWSTTSTLSAITVTSSGNYSVTTTNSVTGCSNTAVQSVSIVPSINVSVSGPSVICSGSASLTAIGASNYTWSANAGSSTLATTVVSPTTTTSYSVLGALGTCTSSAIYSVGIAAPITVSATVSPASVCSGGTVTLSGTGASTYTWSGGVTNNSAFTPTGSGSYTVTGTSSIGCTGTAVANVIVNASPTISVSGGLICSGSSFTLSPTGANTYTYSGGSAVVSPTTTTSFSITAKSAAGCAASNTAVATITVNTAPAITVNSGAICSGNSFTITPSGAISYTISGGSSVVSPTISSTYTVNGTAANGCVSSQGAISNVSVSAAPSLTVPNGAVCAGGSYTINPTGAASYTYSSGSAVVSPTVSSSYTVTGANAIGCTTNKVINVAYNLQPTLSVSSATSVCAGSTLALNTTGATNLIAYYRMDEGSGSTTADLSGNGLNGTLVNSPTWSASTAPFTGSGNNLTFNTAYVNVPDNALFNTLQNQISIEAWIYQTDNANNAIVDRASYNFLFETCPNGQTGLGFYNNGTWNYSSGTVPVNQWVHVAMTYDSNAGLVKFYMNGVLLSSHVRTGALGANAGPLNIGRQEPNNCQCNIFTGKIDELRIWRGVRTADQFLASSNSTITARNYSWTPSASLNSTTAASVLATPTSAIVYTVTLTDANNCSASAVTAFTVNASPTITVPSSTICSGSTTTITASGANTYTWSNSTVASSIVVTPTTSTVYSVSGTNSLGCVSGVSASSITLGAGPSIVVNSSTVCAGTSATLTASGVNTFTWSTGAHSSSIVVTPATNTVYLVNGNLSGCAITASNTASVTVNSLPVITVTNGSLCSGNSFTLNPSGASTYSYSSGSAIVNPTVTTSYSISGTDALGCVSAAPALATVTVNAIPVIAAANGTICGGETFTILPTGAASYTYSGGSNLVSPSTTTFYTISGTSSAGCLSAVATTVSVLVNQAPVITVNSGTICSGNSFTLSASGASTYTYSGGSNIVSPGTNTIYSVIGTSTAGCLSSAPVNATITVNPLPTITVANGTVCNGQSFTISPGGASTYSYSTGNAIVTPTSNTNYSVSGTSSLGCLSTATLSVTMGVSPTLSVSGNSSICAGQSATFTANGAATYSWSSGATTASVVLSPTSTSLYTLTGSSTLACSTTTVMSLNVNANPTLTVTGTSSVCAGETLSLTASGATSYSWNTGATNASISSTGINNTNYTVTGTNSLGCSSSVTSSVAVVQNPTVTITGNSTVCANQSVSLTANGASTYSWSNGALSHSVVSTPSANIAYTVTGFNPQGCSSGTTISITTLSNPTLSIGGTTAICAGQSATLTVSGANTYSWSTAAFNSSIVVSPSVNTTYSVSGTGTTGCSSAAVQELTVNANPTLGIAGTSSICTGQTVNLIANGAATYSWNTGATTASIISTPTNNTSYTVTGTNSLNCSTTMVSSVNVVQNPIVTITGASSLCVSQSVSLTANGASSYSWNTGSTASLITISPSVSLVYTLTGFNVQGCANSVIKSVTVNANPTITITGGSSVCAGQTTTLTANGADSYSWTSSAITSSMVISPTLSSTYTVTGTTTLGCSTSTTQFIQVQVNPTLNVAGTSSICSGQTVNLSVSGASSYSWSTGASSASISTSPSTSVIYSVTGTNTLGCSSSAVNSVTVYPNPTLSLSGSSGICTGQSATLIANGASTYLWNNNSTTNSIITTPSTNTTYTVTGTDALGCSTTTTQLVTVSASLAVSVTGPSSLCLGQSVVLSGNGASTYTWNSSVVSSTISTSPTLTTTYSVTGASGTCSNTAVVTVSVNPNPSVTISGNTVICAGETTTLTAGGAINYTWSSVSNATSVAVSPTATSTYSLTGENGFGCANTATISVVSHSLPVITVSPASLALCLNSTSSLVATGALTYTWSNSANTSSISITATANSVYTVNGSNAEGCVSGSTVAVTTMSLPALVVSPPSATVCAFSPVSFTASGASTYLWSNGANTGTNLVTPGSTTVYFVTGTDTGNGCQGTATVAVTTHSLPVVTAAASQASVCEGSSAVLTATGANSYTWAVLGTNTASLSLTPTVATVYTVTGSDSHSCVASATVELGLYALPVIVATPGQQTICAGELASINASGGSTYSLSTGDVGVSVFTVSPVTLTTYTLSGTDANACVNSTTLSVEVSECLGLPTVGGVNKDICVFPNPSDGRITARFEFEGRKYIRIFNTTGQCIETRVSDNYIENFDLQPYAKGVYYVRISSKQTNGSFRIMVQ